MGRSPSRRSALSLLGGAGAWALAGAPEGARAAPPADIRGAFQLITQDGKPISEKDLLGQPSLVLFGYTHCPDFCPTTLMDLSLLMKEMGAKADRVRVLFVSVDPARDTPEVLREYMSQFDPRILALSGSEDAVRRAMGTFLAFAEKIPQEGHYTYDHSTVVYLSDKTGLFRDQLDLQGGAARAIKQIDALL